MSSDDLLLELRALHPSLIDLSLGRIERLLAELGNPQNKLPPVVHVAGTNGKGSTIAFLRAFLEAAGYVVHVFTSPHLQRFNERVSLGGPCGSAPIEEAALSNVLARTKDANGDASITFFEITTAAAFLAFSETAADILLLETGLGGRLDATNVIACPLLSIITSISIDHSHYLGSTPAQIASEKAGIIKPGCLAVIAHQEGDVLDTLENHARKIKAPLFVSGRDWDAFEQHGRLVFKEEFVNGNADLVDLPLPRLAGHHQIANAGTAIAAARRLKNFQITRKHLALGLKNATWPARLERLSNGNLTGHTHKDTEIWLDGGHNPAAAKALARAMADIEERHPRPLHLICGMMARKDAGAFLKHFVDLVEYVVTIPVPDSDQSYRADALAAIARDAGHVAKSASNIQNALDISRDYAAGPIRILICGSLYIAGHVLAVHGQSDEGFSRSIHHP